MPDEGIHKDDVRSFARLVDCAAPWLDQVVIIGGWAHRLYRIHPLAQPLRLRSFGDLRYGCCDAWQIASAS